MGANLMGPQGKSNEEAFVCPCVISVVRSGFYVAFKVFLMKINIRPHPSESPCARWTFCMLNIANCMLCFLPTVLYIKTGSVRLCTGSFIFYRGSCSEVRSP